jgi:NADH-quinone oxidoreductase subunit J
MLSEFPFYALALVTLVAAIAAMTLRNLVHCALCAAAAFTGVGALYLLLDAPFVGFAQLLVYVGAVAILIIFAVLLTCAAETGPGIAFSSSWLAGVCAVALVLAGLVLPILMSPSLDRLAPPVAGAPVKDIGNQLMTVYVLPLETIGLLLTAALIGAVVIAMQDKPDAQPASDVKPPPREIADKDLCLR